MREIAPAAARVNEDGEDERTGTSKTRVTKSEQKGSGRDASDNASYNL